LAFSCKKQEGLIDNYTDPPDQITTLKPLVISAGREFLEIEWNQVEHSHFEELSYAVYLDGEKIVDQLSSTRYSLINLAPGKKYNIKVVASTNNGKQVEQGFEGNTLPALAESQTVYLHSYRFHDFSQLLGPLGLFKLEDGGHLLVRELAHDTDFTNVHYKMIVFRVDKFGQTLWYRLLTFEDFNLAVDSAAFQFTTIKGEEEAILFAGNYALKFAVSNGEVLMRKSYSDLLPGQRILSAQKVSSEEIIAATDNAHLISVNPDDLRILWHRDSQGQSGTLQSIQVDSKKNVYGVFNDRREQDTPIKVNKYDSKGKFLNSFQFDGTLKEERNWGFIMTSLLVDPEDNLYLFGYNGYFDFTRFFKFKADGTLIKKNEQSERFLIKSAFFNANGEIVASGQEDGDGINTFGGIYVFDKDLNIRTKQIWTSLPPHILSGLTGNTDGTYNLFASLMPVRSQYGDFMFIKTGLNGKI
jgi:outer membrane protein assembly factor BamB